MELQINQEYRIRTDEYNFILEKGSIAKSGNNKGQTVWSLVGYYPEIEWLFKAAVRHGLKVNDLNGIQKIMAFLEKIDRDIKESVSAANLKVLHIQLRKAVMENELLKKQLEKQSGNKDEAEGEGEQVE